MKRKDKKSIELNKWEPTTELRWYAWKEKHIFYKSKFWNSFLGYEYRNKYGLQQKFIYISDDGTIKYEWRYVEQFDEPETRIIKHFN